MNQVVILTGATGGLGSILAKRMLKESIGKLICVYRNESKFQSIYNEVQKDILGYKTYDSDDYKELLKIVDSLDCEEIVVVLNAFSIIPIKRVGEFTYKEIQQMVDGNITQNISLLNCIIAYCKEYFYKLRIINLDSGAADFPLSGWANYCAAKAYINVFLSVILHENPDIKMVSFDPGVMDTAMQRQIRETDPHIFNEVERFVAHKTNGNLIDPEIIANELIKNYITHWKAETLREKYKTRKI